MEAIEAAFRYFRMIEGVENKKAEHIYKTYDDFMKDDCFVTALKFVQEPELGEGDNPKNISQYPLEDILGQILCGGSGFL